MTTDLWIANGISLVAAVFTARSSWAKDAWHIYMYQVAQCLLLAVASIFFHSYAGIVTLLACALRNYLAAIGRLDRKMTALCLLLVLVPGVLLNNRGAVGAIILVANVLYTLGMYLAKGEIAIKLNMIVNLILWILYEAFILDVPSMAADGVGLVTAVASLFRKRSKDQKKTVQNSALQ